MAERTSISVVLHEDWDGHRDQTDKGMTKAVKEAFPERCAEGGDLYLKFNVSIPVPLITDPEIEDHCQLIFNCSAQDIFDAGAIRRVYDEASVTKWYSDQIIAGADPNDLAEEFKTKMEQVLAADKKPKGGLSAEEKTERSKLRAAKAEGLEVNLDEAIAMARKVAAAKKEAAEAATE